MKNERNDAEKGGENANDEEHHHANHTIMQVIHARRMEYITAFFFGLDMQSAHAKCAFRQQRRRQSHATASTRTDPYSGDGFFGWRVL
jgi:hypothetical protein